MLDELGVTPKHLGLPQMIAEILLVLAGQDSSLFKDYTVCGHILRDEYESPVIQTKARLLQQDDAFIRSGSFVSISSIHAIFSEWDAQFKALGYLIDQLEDKADWPPGPLIDLLLEHMNSGVHIVSSLFTHMVG
jgi:hypothetical protein